MGTMQELLQTLIGFQSKHDEALKHQQQVSDYVQLLHEYLSNDRDLRKEEFKTGDLIRPSDSRPRNPLIRVFLLVAAFLSQSRTLCRACRIRSRPYRRRSRP